MNELKDSKTEKIARLIQGYDTHGIDDVLVVGCGNGIEAAILAQILGARVVGVDIEDSFDDGAKAHADLQVCDAVALPFLDSSFDLVYSYHALEHIHDPSRALKEMSRVLRSGGVYWVGTPNRSRLIGYITSGSICGRGKNATINEKIAWNIDDWKSRLTGKFTNELGAHAGFTNGDLYKRLTELFTYNQDAASLYYQEVYGKHKSCLRLIEILRLSRVLYPGVYFMGRK